MVAATQAVEVEIAGPNGRRLFFQPAGQSFRGAVNFAAASSKSALSCRDQWPEPIPGLVLGIDFRTGEKYVREPLYESRHLALRKKIENGGRVLQPERQTFDSESLTTWVYHLHRAVQGGLARVISGELPPLDSLDGQPKKDFIFAPRGPNTESQLAGALTGMAAAIDRNTAVLTKLLERLTK